MQASRESNSLLTRAGIAFLELPAEIRLAIYKHLFDGAILGLIGGQIDTKTSKADAAILRASSTIHAEALPVLHSTLTLTLLGIRAPIFHPKFQKVVSCIEVLNRWNPYGGRHRQPNINTVFLRSFRALKVLQVHASNARVCLPWPEFRLLELEKDKCSDDRIWNLVVVKAAQATTNFEQWRFEECPVTPVMLRKLVQMKNRAFDLVMALQRRIYVDCADKVSLVWRPSR